MGGSLSTSSDNSITEQQKQALNNAIQLVEETDKPHLEKLLENISKPVKQQDDSSTDEPQVTIEIFGSEDKNSEGFYINDYKIKTHNLNKTFSPNDQVEYFLTNVFDYIKNSNLPEGERDTELNNIFHKYTKNVKIDPTKEKEETKQPDQSGGKKKRSRKHKPKYRHRKTKKH
jgi:hypothetical protein